MIALTRSYPPAMERIVERILHAVRLLRVRDDYVLRRRLAATLTRKPFLDHVLDERTGYAVLPVDSMENLRTAVKFAQHVRDERGYQVAKKKQDYNSTILEATRYEDAPPFFDLILSNDVLQIVSDYLGEIPVLMSIKLWCTPVNEYLKGSQLYHRDGQKWLRRGAKFLINMDDVDEDAGPFTFLPADVSSRVSQALGSMKNQGRVPDEQVFRHASPSDAISLVGPAGTGVAVDSSRCFHFGARVRKGERLLLQFQFLRRADAVHGGSLRRSEGFTKRFGDDPVRQLVIPREE
jgi:hypothetical protein